MSKHSSIFSVSIPTREQRTDADKMAFPQPVGGGGGGVGEGSGLGLWRGGGSRKKRGLRDKSAQRRR